MKKLLFETTFFLLIVFSLSGVVEASNKLHPLNKRNIQIGLMPYPEYFPHVPRISAHYAKNLYDQKKGFFLGVGSYDIRVVGGIHMTEREVWDTDFGKLNIPADKVIIVYCP